jgi:cytochrome c oxidase cbb3-type subunit 3
VCSLASADDALDAANGKRTFTVHCVQCHGLDGKGGGHSRNGPSLTDNVTLHGGTFEDIYRVIAEGVPKAAMPQWKQKMSPERIRDVAAYVHSLKGTQTGAPNPRSVLHQ